MSTLSPKFFIAIESGTLSIGVDQLLDPLKQLSHKHNGELICTGGYGLYAYEPLIEIEHIDQRHAFACVVEHDIDSLIVDGEVNQQHPKYVGLSRDLPGLTCQHRFTFKRAGLIDPLSFSQYQAHGGKLGLTKALEKEPQDIIDIIKDSALRGRGGAGFPTGIKWQTVKDAPGSEKYIVCNADEGDSGTFADRLLMEGDPLTLIEGMVIAGYAVGAKQGLIYLRSEYPFTHQRMLQALEIAKENQLLGEHVLGSHFAFDIQLHKGAGAYICGEETSLLESLEGKRGTIRFKPPLPAIQGFKNLPTALNNVITLATVPEIMVQGAQAYNSLGIGRSKGTLTVQLSGNIARGGLYEVPFGITLKQLIYDIGGGSKSKKAVRAVQVGGPLGAYFPETLFHIPLDYEQFSANGGMLGHGGVVVFDESVDLSEQAKFSFEFCAHESCGKCTPCRIGSTRGYELIGQIQKRDAPHQAIELVHDLCELMEKTSLCALGGLTPYPVKSAIKHFPKDFGISDHDKTAQSAL